MNLLCRFTQWTADGQPVTTVGEAEALCAEVAGYDGWIWTRTTRRPRRDLSGGSVYFFSGNATQFRLPFLRIENRRYFLAILMRPEFHRVEQRRVGYQRGWRYLADQDAPPDLPARQQGEGELPEHLRRDLEQLGLYSGEIADAHLPLHENRCLDDDQGRRVLFRVDRRKVGASPKRRQAPGPGCR